MTALRGLLVAGLTLLGASDVSADGAPPEHTREAATAGEATTSTQSGTQVTASQSFNPAISVIPDINFYADDRQGRGFALTRLTDGFRVPGDEPSITFEPDRGFNLREAELAFSGSVDPYFYVWATAIANRDGLTVEEAYVQTTRFIPGFQLRVGRFLSGFGYITRQHPHQWDFFDQALPYEALLGGVLADTGLQLTWLPPLPVYVQFGVEALQGDHPRFAHQAAGEHPDLFADRAGPRLITSWVKVAPPLDYSHELQIGTSFAYSRSHQEAVVEGGRLARGLDGTAWLAGVDVVWRYDSGREYGVGDLTVQGEYLYRKKRIDLIALEEVAVSGVGDERHAQDGLYAQVVYGILPRWTIGGRFDVAGRRNQVERPSGLARFGASRRVSTNLTFNATEFSRVRAQYNLSKARYFGVSERAHQFMVQFQMSLGAHGAHQF